jgi:hypothetical protein
LGFFHTDSATINPQPTGISHVPFAQQISLAPTDYYKFFEGPEPTQQVDNVPKQDELPYARLLDRKDVEDVLRRVVTTSSDIKQSEKADTSITQSALVSFEKPQSIFVDDNQAIAVAKVKPNTASVDTHIKSDDEQVELKKINKSRSPETHRTKSVLHIREEPHYRQGMFLKPARS